MKYCFHCQTELPDQAKFCHQCGTLVEIPLSSCPHCGKNNPAGATHCYSCALPLQQVQHLQLDYQAIYQLTLDQPDLLKEEIKGLFFKLLRKKVEEEIHPGAYSDYVEKYYDSGYHLKFETKIIQIASESADTYAKKGVRSLPGIETLIRSTLQSAVLFHIIHNCAALLPFPLPEQILKYEGISKRPAQIQVMLMDYLQLSREKGDFYTDFIKMPFDKLQNASMHFLYPAKDEKIFLISDQSIFGTCKEGFALTEYGFYWKAALEKSQKVYYHELKEIKRDKDWLIINGRFFNAGLSLNVKLLLLLQKMKECYADLRV